MLKRCAQTKIPTLFLGNHKNKQHQDIVTMNPNNSINNYNNNSYNYHNGNNNNTTASKVLQFVSINVLRTKLLSFKIWTKSSVYPALL